VGCVPVGFMQNYAAQAQTWLQVRLANILTWSGLPAEIYTPQVSTNGYQAFNPENIPIPDNATAVGSCKVKIKDAMGGYLINSSFLSMVDKVNGQEFEIITNQSLVPGQELVVTWPDSITARIRVVTPVKTQHAFSTLVFEYKVIFV